MDYQYKAAETDCDVDPVQDGAAVHMARTRQRRLSPVQARLDAEGQRGASKRRAPAGRKATKGKRAAAKRKIFNIDSETDFSEDTSEELSDESRASPRAKQRERSGRPTGLAKRKRHSPSGSAKPKRRSPSGLAKPKRRSSSASAKRKRRSPSGSAKRELDNTYKKEEASPRTKNRKRSKSAAGTGKRKRSRSPAGLAQRKGTSKPELIETSDSSYEEATKAKTSTKKRRRSRTPAGVNKRPHKRTAKRRSKGRSKNRNLEKKYKLSPELAAIVGVAAASHAEVSTLMWKYFIDMGLQDPGSPAYINCNEELRDLFGVDTLRGFEFQRYVKAHYLQPVNEECSPTGKSNIFSGIWNWMTRRF